MKCFAEDGKDAFAWFFIPNDQKSDVRAAACRDHAMGARKEGWPVKQLKTKAIPEAWR